MPKTIRRKSTSDAVEILRRDLIGNDPRAAAEYEQLKVDLTVAREIHGLREAAGLTPGATCPANWSEPNGHQPVGGCRLRRRFAGDAQPCRCRAWL